MFSLLIPVFNEEGAVSDTVRRAHGILTGLGEPFEIVVVDDGSTDGTPDILRGIDLPHVVIVGHQLNRGYGASLKTGIRHSQGDVLGIADADGTYPLEELPTLLAEMRATGADMTVGARTKSGVKIPWNRKPAKAIVGWLANVLTGMKIPDLNSGMRVFSRVLVERYMHLYPQRFSFTTTLTLAALTNDYIVTFHPIDYGKRIGKSTLSSGTNGVKNFIAFLGLVVRVVTYFRPLRFFAAVGLPLFLLGLALIVHTVTVERNISDAGLLLSLVGLQITLFGLLADITARVRSAA